MEDFFKKRNVSITLTLSDLQDFAEEVAHNVISSLREEEADKETITADEVKAFFRISPTTLWRWNQRNVIHAVKVGGRVLYRKKEIEQAMKGGRHE